MAINSTYYLDADDLILSTAVYLDSSLTLIAPDGFYGDGTTTREQSSGILLVAEGCPSCAAPCDTSIGSSGSTGVYKVNLDVGSSETGAIIVTFSPQNIPDGIRVTYDGVVYNKISSPISGPFQCPNPGHFAIIGTTSATGGCTSWYPAGQTQTNPVYLYNPSLLPPNQFQNTGTTQIDVIVGTSSAPTLQPDYFLTSAGMGECVMVIPKPSATPSALLIEMIGPCTSTGWSFSAACPVKLPTFLSSEVYAKEGDVACAQVLINTFYFAKVHTAADNFVGLYDYVFFDENGRFPLVDGFYLTDSAAVARQILEVENGVIVGMTSCDSELPVTGLNWILTVDNPCNSTPWVISNENLTIRYNVTDSAGLCGGTCSDIQAGTATATITVGGLDVNMGLSFTGIGEREASNYEKILFKLDGVQIANANAPGGNLGCQMGPVVQTYQIPPPYLLLANNVYTLFIDFTTADEQYHVGAFYEVNLTFVEIP